MELLIYQLWLIRTLTQKDNWGVYLLTISLSIIGIFILSKCMENHQVWNWVLKLDGIHWYSFIEKLIVISEDIILHMIVMISISPLGTDVSSVDLSQAKLRKKNEKKSSKQILIFLYFSRMWNSMCRNAILL